MEVTEGKSSLKINSGIESKFIEIEIPPSQIDVNIESESDDEVVSEIDLSYADHAIKEEMVTGPEDFHKPIYNFNHSQDLLQHKKPKREKLYKKTSREGLQTETTQEIGAEEYILPHKKPRLQKHQIREENSNNCTEDDLTPDFFLEIDLSTDIQTKQKEMVKTPSKARVQDKNIYINQVTTYNNVYTCNDCSDHFKRKRELMLESHEINGVLKTHLEIGHSSKRINMCGICGDVIDPGEKLYSCSMCQYKCNNKGSLTKHMMIHTGEKPVSCTLCEYRCINKSQLNRHMKNHNDEKQFSCTVCEYGCTQKSHFIDHMKIHTGHKPFSCTMCEYRCTTKASLIKHIMIHTGEKPFSCNVCEYRCNDKSNLTKHMKIHTGEKPFSCPMCEYKCVRKCDIKIHIERIHNK